MEDKEIYISDLFNTINQNHDGRSWPQPPALSMIGTDRLTNVQYCCEYAINNNIEGDFIECGVWKGGTCIFMRGILKAYDDLTRKVYVADSFKGCPKADTITYPQDIGDTHEGLAAVPLNEVKTNFETNGLLDDQVVFLEGWFKDTLMDAPIEKLSVLRIDGDSYGSYTDVFKALYHKVSKGGFVIIDDYNMDPVKQAVSDWFSQNSITSQLIVIDHTGVYWQV